VEADRLLVGRRQVRMEPGLERLLRQALGVLADLGERHVGVGEVEAGGTQLGLELLETPQVGPDGHETQVGLVAEDGEGDDLAVVFIPYPTGIFGEALRRGDGARTAAIAYSLTMAVNSYAWAALWLYASTGRRLLDESFPEDQRRPATLAFTSGPLLYTIAVG